MSTSDGEDLLRCGRSADEILDQIAEGRADERDEHQLRCPHCQAAVAEYDRLWSPIRAAGAQQLSAPDGVVDAALRRLRSAIAHPDHGVLESPLGVTRISARVVVVAARLSAQNVPGVRVALSRRLVGAPAPRAHGGAPDAPDAEISAGVAGRSTAIEITLAAEYGIDLPALAERVRAEVSTRVRALTDLEPVQVTVIIDDVFS